MFIKVESLFRNSEKASLDHLQCKSDKYLFLVPKLYLDLLYFVCISPIKLTLTESNPSNHFPRFCYKLGGNFFQRILYYLIILLIFINILSENLSSSLGNQRNPYLYFKALYKFMLFPALIIQISLFCFHPNSIVLVANFILHSAPNSLPIPERKCLQKVWIITSIYILIYLGNGIGNVFVSSSKLALNHTQTYSGWEVGKGGALAFAEGLNDTVLESILGAAGFLGMFYTKLLTLTENVFLTSLVISLWLPTYTFVSRLPQTSPPVPGYLFDFRKGKAEQTQVTLDPDSWKNIQEEYKSIKQLSILINQAIATRLASHILRNMLFNAINFVAGMSWRVLFSTFVSFSIPALNVLIAADIPRKVETRQPV